MKQFFKFSVICLFLAVPFVTQAQKFAHINYEALVESMPQKDSALQVLQKEYNEVKVMIEEMQVEFNKKVENAKKTYEQMSVSSKQLLEQQLQEDQQRIQQFQMTSEERLMKRREELLAPIMAKAEAAVKKVAEREGYLYVFDVSKGSQVLYYSKQSIDILPLAKKELGIVTK